MESVISALITGGLALIGTVITVIISNNKTQAKMDKSQAVMETKVDELTREVREHNGFAKRMPVVEAQIDMINHRVDNLEKSANHKKTE